MAGNIELWMPFNGEYMSVLSIPVATSHQFSIHPLAWLRYVGFTIYGTEGYISTLEGGPEVDYFQLDDLAGLYYYVSQDPHLIDPDGMDDRTSNTGTLSTLRGDFRDRVVARDGTCVMTGATGPPVDACHIIPHAKGHQAAYIAKLVEERIGQYFEVLHQPLNAINDTRNGIFLSKVIHYYLRPSTIAFLRTPNFAMTVNDVDLVIQPTADALGFPRHPSVAPSRLTMQHFATLDTVTGFLIPHNSDARQSNSDDWPHPLLFDVAYGCAALKAWGVGAFIQFSRTHARDVYYGLREGDNEDHDDGGGGDTGDAAGRSNEQPQSRSHYNLRAAKGKGKSLGKTRKDASAQDGITYAAMIMALWTRNAKRVPRQAETQEKENQKRVRKWRESVESS